MRFNNFWKKRCFLSESCEEMKGNRTTHVLLNDQRNFWTLEEVIKAPWQCYLRHPQLWDTEKTENNKFYSTTELLPLNCTFVRKSLWDSAIQRIRTEDRNYTGPISPTTGFLGALMLAGDCIEITFFGFSKEPLPSWPPHRYSTEHTILGKMYPHAKFVPKRKNEPTNMPG